MDDTYNYLDLNQYCREVRQYRQLSHEEEYKLTRQYQEGNEAAGQEIVKTNLMFVVNVCRKYFYSGHNYLDIIQEGNLGLIQALKRFDPERGVRFTSYAVWWIKAFIKKFMYKSTKVHTGTLTHARELVSLDEQLGSDDATNSRLLDFLTDEDDPEKLFHVRQVSDNISSLLAESFRFLSKREVFILRKRFFSDPPLTLKQIADQLGVSRERVRQIEAKSIKKLKKILEDPPGRLLEYETVDSHPFPRNGQSGILEKGSHQN